MIEPITLGGGKRLFPDDGTARPLELGVHDRRRDRRADLHLPARLTASARHGAPRARRQPFLASPNPGAPVGETRSGRGLHRRHAWDGAVLRSGERARPAGLVR